MKVLIACEESQSECKAFRERGHEAYSCDIQDCSGGHPEWHIKRDVLEILRGGCDFVTMDGKLHRIDGRWDLIIAHPPCTDLASSGARWFAQKREDGRQIRSIEFFAKFVVADCDKIAIENPVGIMGSDYVARWFMEYAWIPKYSQIIQPYQFGHAISKKTCLWLKGLPNLKPTKIVEPEWRTDGSGKRYSGSAFYAMDENGKVLAWNDPRTKVIRSKSFDGISKAMAEQWG